MLPSPRLQARKILILALPPGDQNKVLALSAAKALQRSLGGTQIGAFGVVYIEHATDLSYIFAAVRQAPDTF